MTAEPTYLDTASAARVLRCTESAAGALLEPVGKAMRDTPGRPRALYRADEIRLAAELRNACRISLAASIDVARALLDGRVRVITRQLREI